MNIKHILLLTIFVGGVVKSSAPQKPRVEDYMEDVDFTDVIYNISLKAKFSAPVGILFTGLRKINKNTLRIATKYRQKFNNDPKDGTGFIYCHIQVDKTDRPNLTFKDDSNKGRCDMNPFGINIRHDCSWELNPDEELVKNIYFPKDDVSIGIQPESRTLTMIRPQHIKRVLLGIPQPKTVTFDNQAQQTKLVDRKEEKKEEKKR